MNLKEIYDLDDATDVDEISSEKILGQMKSGIKTSKLLKIVPFHVVIANWWA